MISSFQVGRFCLLNCEVTGVSLVSLFQPSAHKELDFIDRTVQVVPFKNRTPIKVDWMNFGDLETCRDIIDQQISLWLKQEALFDPDIEDFWRRLRGIC